MEVLGAWGGGMGAGAACGDGGGAGTSPIHGHGCGLLSADTMHVRGLSMARGDDGEQG